MNLRETIPSQADIEEFLGRDFFPKYSHPMPMRETIDMVQLQFGISDEARALKAPKAHGTDGTILECLTLFAVQRLVDRGFLVHIERSTYKWKSGVRYFGKEVPTKDVRHCVYRLEQMASVKMTLPESLLLLKSTWNEATVLAAAHTFQLTTNKHSDMVLA